MVSHGGHPVGADSINDKFPGQIRQVVGQAGGLADQLAGQIDPPSRHKALGHFASELLE